MREVLIAERIVRIFWDFLKVSPFVFHHLRRWWVSKTSSFKTPDSIIWSFPFSLTFPSSPKEGSRVVKTDTLGERALPFLFTLRKSQCCTLSQLPRPPWLLETLAPPSLCSALQTEQHRWCQHLSSQGNIQSSRSGKQRGTYVLSCSWLCVQRRKENRKKL